MEDQKGKFLNIIRQPIVWIVLVGFVLRLGSFAVNHEEMRWQNDARMSIPAARLLDGKGFTLQDGAGPTAYRPPLYVLWLALCYAIFGKFATVGPSFLQILVSTGNILLLFLLTKQITKRDDAALGAAALLAIHPYSVYHDPALYHTFLSTALLLGGFLFLFKGFESKRALHLGISGALFGACVLIMSTIVPFLGLLVVAALFGWKIAIKQRLLLVTAFCVGMMLTWGPWIIRNALVFHELIPLTTESGVTLWIGNSPYAKELLKTREQEATPVPEGTPFNLPENYAGCKPEGWCRGGVTESEENRALAALAKDWIKTHPREFIELTIWRYAGIWSPFLTPAKQFGSSKIFTILLTYGYMLWNLVLAGFFVVGAWRLWKEKKYLEVTLPLFLALSATGAYAIFLYFTKYRIPFEAVLLAVCGVGVAHVVRACYLFATRQQEMKHD
jgi:4-amino-4-deoxy-L-arabinose transferase-like glycosyltransferase